MTREEMTREEMTREDIIYDLRLLWSYYHQFDGEHSLRHCAALSEALEALQTEPCEDAISRQAALDLLLHVDTSDNYEFERIEREIKELPSVTVKKTGKWISTKVRGLFSYNSFKCSVCGNFLNFDGVNAGRGNANFCPNCGAKMEVE